MRNKSVEKSMSPLDREKALFLYNRALDRGDFDTVALLLAQAEQDPVLAQMIAELNDYYSSRSILPFKRPAVPDRNYLQRETNMQIVGKLDRSLQKPYRLRTPLSLFAAVAAASIVGIMLFAQLWQIPKVPGPNQGSGVSAAAPSATSTDIPTPTPIPSSVLFTLSGSPLPGYEAISIPPNLSDEQARAMILKKVEEALKDSVPSTVMVQIVVPGQPPRLMTFFRGAEPNFQVVPNAFATAQLIPIPSGDWLTAFPPFEKWGTFQPMDIAPPVEIVGTPQNLDILPTPVPMDIIPSPYVIIVTATPTPVPNK